MAGPQFLVTDRGLAPQALRDITNGVEAGRFTAPKPSLALAVVAGSVLAFVQIRLTGDALGDDDADELAATLLTTLGLSPADAHEVAHRPLPVLNPPSRSPERPDRRGRPA